MQPKIADLDVGRESTNYAKLHVAWTLETVWQTAVRREALAEAGRLMNALA